MTKAKASTVTKTSKVPELKKNDDSILAAPKPKVGVDLNAILHMREELKCKK
jgi:hypothetical protein